MIITAKIAFSSNRVYHHVHLNMNEPNNGQNEQQPGRQTKGEIVAQREQVRMLGIALGNWREAARQCGLSKGRVLNWCATAGNSQNASKHPILVKCCRRLSVLSLLLNRFRNV